MHLRVLKPCWGPVGEEVVLSDRLETGRCAPNVPLAQAGAQLSELESYVRHARKNPMEFDFDIP